MTDEIPDAADIRKEDGPVALEHELKNIAVKIAARRHSREPYQYVCVRELSDEAKKFLVEEKHFKVFPDPGNAFDDTNDGWVISWQEQNPTTAVTK